MSLSNIPKLNIIASDLNVAYRKIAKAEEDLFLNKFKANPRC